MLLVELAKTDRHLAAARARCGDNNKRTGGLHIIVPSKAILAIYKRDIIRIAIYGVVIVSFNIQSLKPLPVEVCRVLAIIVGYYNAAYIKPKSGKLLAEP